MKSSVLVYSTDSGRICPGCRQPIAKCRCKATEAVPSGDGVVRVSRETKGRGGKGVSLIKGVPLDGAGLLAMAKEFKALCATGGTAKEGVIEIQGDHVDRLVAALAAKGMKVKKA